MFASVALCLIAMFSSCERTVNDVSKIVAERDSLAQQNAYQKAELENLTSCINTISSGLDSIAQQENMIQFNGREGTGMTAAELKKAFEDYGNLIARQRSRISNLEDSLKNGKAKVPELQKMISYLNSQLEAKEKEIAQLKAQVNNLIGSQRTINSNEIAQLKAQVNSQKRDVKALKDYIEVSDKKVADLDKENAVQKEVIKTQDKIINHGYIRIGTKKELTDAGLLSTRFLASPKLVTNNLNSSTCQSIDVRNVTEITLNSKKPKILTSMPSKSYTIQKSSSGSVLVITDVALFWSQSNYLVIML